MEVGSRFLFPRTQALFEYLRAVDETTANHSLMVGELCWQMANELGWQDQCGWLREAGTLHDIGKINLPRSILHSTKIFTPGERKTVEQHVRYTGDILLKYAYPPELIRACVQHHERLDGTGYPAGLKGKEICPGGRLLAVADVFSALISPRPYRGALPVKKALDLMLEEAYSRKLDSSLVWCLVEMNLENLKETAESNKLLTPVSVN